MDSRYCAGSTPFVSPIPAPTAIEASALDGRERPGVDRTVPEQSKTEIGFESYFQFASAFYQNKAWFDKINDQQASGGGVKMECGLKHRQDEEIK